MWMQTYKYSSVDTELGEYDASSLLSPISKLVYKQWKMDGKDQLLVDGYYRESDMTSYALPFDIRQVIISYYLKEYSKGTLKRKVEEIATQKKRQREQRIENIRWYFVICYAIIGIFGLILSPDIAALIIVNINNCNLAIDISESSNISINLGVNEYLSIGSIIHIIFVVSMPIIIYRGIQYNDDGLICYIRSDDKLYRIIYHSISYFSFFFISWCVIGGILYSQMDETTECNQQCSDMMISWVVIKLILYAVFMPFFLCYLADPNIFFSIRSILMRMLVLLLLIAPDIAGLVIINTNECDDGSDINIAQWLLIGCILHIVFTTQWLLMVLWIGHRDIDIEDNWDVIGWHVVPSCCTCLFFFVWDAIGLGIISETNSEHKQCKCMAVIWMTFTFIECMVLYRFLLVTFCNIFC